MQPTSPYLIQLSKRAVMRSCPLRTQLDLVNVPPASFARKHLSLPAGPRQHIEVVSVVAVGSPSLGH